MIARSELMDWPAGAHASTFGGNPVAVAAALATLDVLEAGLIENAARVGAHLMSRMNDWPSASPRWARCAAGSDDRHPVRGAPGRPRERPRLRDQLVQMAFERGLLVLAPAIALCASARPWSSPPSKPTSPAGSWRSACASRIVPCARRRRSKTIP